MPLRGIHLGGCPRIGFCVISTEGRNLKPAYFQYSKISRCARNDSFGEFSDSLLERQSQLRFSGESRIGVLDRLRIEVPERLRNPADSVS